MCFLVAISITGCLHHGDKASLYCDGVLIGTGERGILVHESYYKYKVNGQNYRYTPKKGSTCKIVEDDS